MTQTGIASILHAGVAMTTLALSAAAAVEEADTWGGRTEHPVFGDLPHEGVLSPLLFRVIVKGLPLGDGTALAGKTPLMVGEGGADCFAYVVESERNGARLVESFGLDLLSGKPEGTAILDGMIARAGGAFPP